MRDGPGQPQDREGCPWGTQESCLEVEPREVAGGGALEEKGFVRQEKAFQSEGTVHITMKGRRV